MTCDATDQDACPDPGGLSGRAILLWSAGMFLVLGLVAFAGTVAVPFLQARQAVRANPVGEPAALAAVAGLAGPERAAAKLRLYLRLARPAATERQTAVFLLGFCGKPAVPALVESLAEADAGVRLFACTALGRIGPDAARAVPALVWATGDPDRHVRAGAALALESVGEDGLDALGRALRGPDDQVRRAAAEALVRIGRRAVPTITTALENPEADVRGLATWALGALREPADELVRALVDDDRMVRFNAAAALHRISNQRLYVRALSLDEPAVRRSAALELGLLADCDPETIDALTAALADKDSIVRSNAAWALGRISPLDLNPGRSPVPALQAALKDQDLNVRTDAAAALKKLGGSRSR